jgi:hypothetical protein
VLFSKDSVADFVNRFFEPVWESVRPVPIVRIDFGNGNVLTRTLHGNILTSVCSADGTVLDALPGIYTEVAYVDRLDQFRLMGQYVNKLAPERREEWLRGYHERQAESLKKGQTPEQFALSARIAAVTKRDIERPTFEVVLLAGARPRYSSDKDQPRPELEKKGDVANWKELAEDTRLNETTRRRQIHELLAAAGAVKPAKVTRPIYKDVLHADLDDPYLGLGKALFDNYPFAREDAGR